jgi:ABC-type sugar transport system permease subunit
MSKRTWLRGDRVAPYLFILPFYIIFIVFSLFPILRAFFLSFTDWRGVRGGEWIGLRNYDVLLGDPSFWHAVQNTVLVWLLAVPVLTFGGLVLAAILNQKWIKGRYLIRLSIFSPVVVSLVVAGVVFLLILDPDFGPFGAIARAFGWASLNITTDQGAAVPAIAMVTIWRWLGWNMVIMLAGLQTIPTEIEEAAIVDGASPRQTFFYITVPMMRPVIVFATVLSTIGTFNLFDEPFVLFGRSGGPGEAGLMLGTYIYRSAFEFFQFGFSSASAYVVATIVFIASLIQYRMAGRIRTEE